jgi:hypothetical protein
MLRLDAVAHDLHEGTGVGLGQEREDVAPDRAGILLPVVGVGLRERHYPALGVREGLDALGVDPHHHFEALEEAPTVVDRLDGHRDVAVLLEAARGAEGPSDHGLGPREREAAQGAAVRRGQVRVPEGTEPIADELRRAVPRSRTIARRPGLVRQVTGGGPIAAPRASVGRSDAGRRGGVGAGTGGCPDDEEAGQGEECRLRCSWYSHADLHRGGTPLPRWPVRGGDVNCRG